jgi:hypothetical protein
MPPVRFEPIIPASDLPQTHALDLAAPGIGLIHFSSFILKFQRWPITAEIVAEVYEYGKTPLDVTSLPN